ncbi:hypothetical protein TTHERM_00241830 (macronuclear) [Tetrahymena thermophila SB210]|uniref:Uncharacterized protein n=1 Tax=Tetrahymena thermophila (strain SB210) TaxID=312017 RepID=I7MMD8_TETTS|nr:hypothetical protein TTHERM_00241830 [Tetrahymena thermophila SB210]EAS04662.2 hypothetical protein TTHERM_00241830 [Tetrahymena thermophila SB210]|eukprot:XP_001024907.2 hypothetical protein TTHERM_00241830 [Tetrahymena thermophila SB210]
MNKSQIQQINTDHRKKYGFQDQKIKLQLLLKEQSNYRNKEIQNINSLAQTKYLNLASDKKQYSSQATQIQDDLLDYGQNIDKYYNQMFQEENQDDQNNSWDRSQNNSIVMQSRYENDDSKQCTPEVSYVQKYKQNFHSKNQKQLIYLHIPNESEQGNQSFSSVIRRCSSNLCSIKQEINQKPKIKQLDDNSTYFNSNCFPSISNNTSQLKKQIQINYKEVYKLFCSKMKQQEEDKRNQSKLNTSQFNNSQFPVNYRTPFINNPISKAEDQISQQKKMYFVSSHGYGENEYQPSTIGKVFSNAVSRKTSIEESKIELKNWNLAKFNHIQDNQSKKEDIRYYSKQINESQSQKNIEKLKFAKNQQIFENQKENNHTNRKFNQQLVQRNVLQFKQAFEIPSQQLNQHHEIQPKRLLKKYFSVKQLNLDTSKHSKNVNVEQSDNLERNLIIKQIDNYSNQSSKFNSQKNLQFQQYALETWKYRNKTCEQEPQNQIKSKQIVDKNKLQVLDKNYFENYYS